MAVCFCGCVCMDLKLLYVSWIWDIAISLLNFYLVSGYF